MRIFTVTCDGRPMAVVRAADPGDAVDIARGLMASVPLRGNLGAREPRDAEMVSWLEHRDDHLLDETVSA